jgi:hypothetical protein
MPDDVVLIPGEACCQCGGPLLAEPHTKTVFVEKSLDYVRQTVWVCYACGCENILQSEPRYVF